MGCNSCKSQKELAPEEIILSAYEQSLGIHTHDLQSINRIFHHNSTSSSMSISQLERSFSELSLNLSSFQDFYSLFKDNYQYNMKKLISLGILLSKNSANCKLKILFKNYDKDASSELTKMELEDMMNDLVQISCKIIPKSALKQHYNEGLQLYYDKIKRMWKSIAKQLVGIVIEGKESITERDFYLSYQRDDGVRNILSTCAIREYCLQVTNSLSGTVGKLIRRMSLAEQEEALSAIHVRKTRRRRSKKLKDKKEVEN